MGCLAEFVNMIYALLLVDWYSWSEKEKKGLMALMMLSFCQETSQRISSLRIYDQ